MLRILFYVLLVIVIGVSVYFKQQHINEKRSLPAVSIRSEFLRHGVPVETYRLKKIDVKERLRISAQLASKLDGYFTARVSGQNRKEIAKGQPVQLLIGQNVLMASVVEISTQKDLLTGLYSIGIQALEGEIKKYESRLTEGDSHIADILTQTRSNILALPSQLVKEKSGKAYLWVIEEGIAKRREVVKGELLQKHIEIRTGVTPGERVVVRGAARLEEGQQVRIVNELNVQEMNI